MKFSWNLFHLSDIVLDLVVEKLSLLSMKGVAVNPLWLRMCFLWCKGEKVKSYTCYRIVTGEFNFLNYLYIKKIWYSEGSIIQMPSLSLVILYRHLLIVFNLTVNKMKGFRNWILLVFTELCLYMFVVLCPLSRSFRYCLIHYTFPTVLFPAICIAKKKYNIQIQV